MKEDNLSAIRHTLAHLLAAAVSELYPTAKPTLGPAIDTGFYYDFDFSTQLPEKELPKIETRMRELLSKWHVMREEQVSAEDARAFCKKNSYKLELVDEILDRHEVITLYTVGPEATSYKLRAPSSFTDLCRGGHVESPAKEIPAGAFKLDRIAGAYWRGNEKNKMLTRIYGLAFESKEKLDSYIIQREEAKKRDHRKLGLELDLFTFSELVGAGLPLFTPKGTVLRHELDAYVWSLRKKYGYERVTIPHFTKRDLYEISGHWEKFADELFKVATRENKEYAVKPMNCPHHIQIFARRPHSYREMPARYAETTMVYRNEQSGELGGLTRVLSITQDDSHVFCRHNQVKQEFFAIWDIIDTFYKTFDFNNLHVQLSFHDQKEPQKYLGTPEVWKNAEDSLREIAKERNADYVEAVGEAAMYGPKLDFIATDSLGRQHQVATIQLDLNLPERFDLTCINEQGEKERIVMIHCAVMGSLERFSAVLIEHLGGNFPLWLSPVQVKVLPIGEAQQLFAKEVAEKLKTSNIRAELDITNESLGKKIRAVRLEKIPVWLVIGEKEVVAQSATLETRSEGSKGLLPIADIIAILSKQIGERQL